VLAHHAVTTAAAPCLSQRVNPYSLKMSLPENNNKKCRIAVDAMGGDFAPLNQIKGAIEAQSASDFIEVYLIGKSDIIKNCLKENNLTFSENRIIHAEEVIAMDETPTQAIRTKKNSSIVLGNKLIKENSLDAFVSAGNTGAMMASATLDLGRIPGCGRPTIGSIMPSEKGITTLFDVGASVDSKPAHIVEYAIMGSIYVKEIFNIPEPKVGLLSVGEEDSKGNEVTIAALPLLRKTNLNFVGNVEGRDILNGSVNVVVCDGFTGNIILKFGESVLTLLKNLVRSYAEKGFVNKLKALLIKSTLKEILKGFDYQEHGGVPLLGVKGVCIIGHGSSTPKAMKNMILRAFDMHNKNLIKKIENSLKEYSL